MKCLKSNFIELSLDVYSLQRGTISEVYDRILMTEHLLLQSHVKINANKAC